MTPWGAFVCRFTVQTPLAWWKKLSSDVERIADRDGDWQQMVQERIDGLTEFLARRTDEGEPRNWSD